MEDLRFLYEESCFQIYWCFWGISWKHLRLNNFKIKFWGILCGKISFFITIFQQDHKNIFKNFSVFYVESQVYFSSRFNTNISPSYSPFPPQKRCKFNHIQTSILIYQITIPFPNKKNFSPHFLFTFQSTFHPYRHWLLTIPDE